MKPEELKPVVDALIFASDMPLGMARIKQIIMEVAQEDVAASEIRAVIDDINRDNRESQRGFYMQEVAGGYQYRTRPNYAQWVKKLKKVKAFRLTQSTLETLAIIAYKQPIIRSEVEKLRGVDSGGVIKNLIERSLIKIVGRKNIPGRPFMFGTTRRFLEVFGLSRLQDLPSLKEFDSLDESKLPTILREKIPQELFDPDEAEEPGEDGSLQPAPVTDKQISEAGLAAEYLDTSEAAEAFEPPEGPPVCSDGAADEHADPGAASAGIDAPEEGIGSDAAEVFDAGGEETFFEDSDHSGPAGSSDEEVAEAGDEETFFDGAPESPGAAGEDEASGEGACAEPENDGERS